MEIQYSIKEIVNTGFDLLIDYPESGGKEWFATTRFSESGRYSAENYSVFH